MRKFIKKVLGIGKNILCWLKIAICKVSKLIASEIKKACKALVKFFKSQLTWFILFNLFLIIGMVIVGMLEINKTISLSLFMPSLIEKESIIRDVCQIITALIICVVTIISISISIQTDKIYGVEARTFLKIRVMPYFSFKWITIISLILGIMTAIGCILQYYITVMTVCIVSMIYCFWFLFAEIPIMSRNENTIRNILRRRMKRQLIALDYNPQKRIKKNQISHNVDFKTVINNVYNEKQLLGSLEFLSNNIESNSEYNNKLFVNILQERVIYIDSLKFNEDKELINSKFDELFNDINNLVNSYYKFSNYIYDNDDWFNLVFRAIYIMKNNENYKSFQYQMDRIVYNCLVALNYKKELSSKLFIEQLLKYIMTSSLKDGELWGIKAFNQAFGQTKYYLNENSPIALIFATLSWYLYYLLKNENTYPEDKKNCIKEYLESEKLKYTWKDLYERFSEYAKVPLLSLLELYDNDHYWEYFTIGDSKWVVLTNRFIIEWYLKYLINSYSIYDFKVETLESLPIEYHDDIKNILECWFKNDGTFNVENINDIEEIFGISNISARAFYEDDRLKKPWQDLKTKLLRADLEEDAVNCDKSIDDECIESEKIKSNIIERITSHYEYDEGLDVDSSCQQKYYYNMVEIFDSPNQPFDEFYSQVYYESILEMIKEQITPCIFLESNLQKGFDIVYKNKLEYAHSKIPDYALNRFENLSNKEEFIKYNDGVTEIENSILRPYTYSKQRAFRYNILIDSCCVEKLNDQQINEEIEKNYSKEDGQYIFRGVFVSREVLVKILKQKFRTIKLIFRCRHAIEKENIVELDIFGFRERIEKRKKQEKN